MEAETLSGAPICADTVVVARGVDMPLRVLLPSAYASGNPAKNVPPELFFASFPLGARLTSH